MFCFHEMISKITIDYNNKANKKAQTIFINALKEEKFKLNSKK